MYIQHAAYAATLMLLAVPSLPAQNAADLKSDREQLIGEWRVRSVKTIDVPGPFSRQDYSQAEAELAKASCRISADRMVFTVGSQERSATIMIDELKSPKTIDLGARVFPFFQKDVKMPGIYELSGDRLTLCFDPRNSVRPTQFRPTGKDGQLSLFVIELARMPAKR